MNNFPFCQPVEITVAAHDTTGGMATKISEAAMIAKLGIDVYIVKVEIFSVVVLLNPSPAFFIGLGISCWEYLVALQAATSHSMRALNGELRGAGIPDDWLGTIIRFSR